MLSSVRERLIDGDIRALLAFGSCHFDEDGDPIDEIGRKATELDRSLQDQADALHGDINLTEATIRVEEAEEKLFKLIFRN